MNNKCKICGSETNLISHSKFGDYHWCEKCEFISKDKSFHPSKEDELRIYNQHNNSIEDPRYVDFFTTFIEDTILEYVNEGKKGFDFGSGPSPVLAQILEKYYGYNMDIYDLFYANEKSYIGNKYDLITSTEVIEHLEDPIPYFKLFVELMKDDTLLAIMTLFHKNDEAHFLCWNYMRDITHLSFYNLKTFEYIAKEVGLKIIYTNNIRYITFMKDKDI
jgi:hypothetical protein